MLLYICRVMKKNVIGLVYGVSVETKKHVNCCRRADTRAKVISLGCSFLEIVTNVNNLIECGGLLVKTSCVASVVMKQGVVGDVMHHLYMECRRSLHRALDPLIISLIGSDKPNRIGHG